MTAAVAAAVAASTGSSGAQDFYAGRTVQFIIGSAPGGGFDTQSRLIARHIGNSIPGRPSVVAQNMPGAGGIRAADYLYFAAAKDGTAVGMVDPGIYNSQVLGEPGIRFDTTKFTWVGRMVNNSPIVFTWHTSPIKSHKDLFDKQAFIAASGPTPRLNYILLNTVLKSKIKTILGYSGSGVAILALERGEIHGLSMPWPVLKSMKPDWVRENKVIPILQTGSDTHPELRNVPRMIDLATSEEDKKLFEFFALPSLLGRAVMAPPGIPDQRRDELRTAFTRTMQDAAFLAEVQRSKFDLAPMTGAELENFIKKDAVFPPAVIARAKEIREIYNRERKSGKK
jgi:tripartite-type tricarboxylate transporter receptor subunit TctC